MKIIEKKQNVEKVIKKTCQKCKSKLAYSPSNLKIDRDGKYLECPCCFSYIGISQHIAPDEAIRQIEITKQTAIDFANWLDKLTPSQRN